MKPNRHFIIAMLAVVAVSLFSSGIRPGISIAAGPADANVFNIKTFGAKGDGKTIDSAAINKTIEAVAPFSFRQEIISPSRST